MATTFVVDTNAIIDFFNDIFDQEAMLSKKSRQIIGKALSSIENDHKLSIPSVAFIEIYEKWCKTTEFTAKVKYEIVKPLVESPNIEIKPIEREVLENLMLVEGPLLNHEINDKIIVASALMLQWPIITLDEKIKAFIDESNIIPYHLS